MRVIAGEFRSRRLKTLPGDSVRPTPDRLRESLFNILAPRIRGSVFIDAYAGTGAVGIEALSRGAAKVVLLEKNMAAAKLIRENLAALGAEDRAMLIVGPATTTLLRVEADIYFIDPPYDAQCEYKSALELLGATKLRDEALVLAQHDKHAPLEENYGTLRRVRVLTQGDNIISFFQV